jgi:hypothetical protein
MCVVTEFVLPLGWEWLKLEQGVTVEYSSFVALIGSFFSLLSLSNLSLAGFFPCLISARIVIVTMDKEKQRIALG